MPRPQNKEEFRKQMAEAFANVLEQKGLTWKQEWSGGFMKPMNGVTKVPYRGTNSFWLSVVSMSQGYKDPRWVTSIQVNDAQRKYHPGQFWHIKAGSKATYVEYWYPFNLKEHKGYTWPEYREALLGGKSADEFFLTARYTPVFNAEQIEGMPPMEQPERNNDISIDHLVKTLSEAMGVAILTDKETAYYTPMQDTIHMPPPERFSDEYAFNATALHELAHATGHGTRLKRPLTAFFGTPEYAKEELVAEIASCFMGADLRIEPTEEHINNHKAYVQSWVKDIRDEPDVLVKAIHDAQCATDYMEMKAELITPEKYMEAQEKTVTFRTRQQVARAAR